MTNAGRDSGSSQFFITHQPNPQWDGRYTAFGRITKGMKVLYKLKMVDKTKPFTSETTPSKINRISIVYKRPTSTYAPTKLPKTPRNEGSSSRKVEGSNNK